MAEHSSIEWTDATWNPTRGCTRVSPGCGGPGPHGGCYAEGMAARFSKEGQWGHGFAEMKGGVPRWTGKVELIEKMLTLPLTWRQPRKIFVNSTSDLFHEKLSDEDIDRVFAVMALCPQHTFQILTKRPERMLEYMTAPVKGPWAGRYTVVGDDGVAHPGTDVDFRMLSVLCEILPKCPPDGLNRAADWQDNHYPDGDGFIRKWPLENVWLGTSCEDQERADERIPLLLQTPAVVRFISAEPLLGPINLTPYLAPEFSRCQNDGSPAVHEIARAVAGRFGGLNYLDQIIVGGESGQRARPMNPQWARDLRDQCTAAGVAYFHKQNGEYASVSEVEGPGEHFTFPDHRTVRRVGKKRAGRLLDGRTHDEFPR